MNRGMGCLLGFVAGAVFLIATAWLFIWSLPPLVPS